MAFKVTKKQDRAIIVKLFALGHFYNPAYFGKNPDIKTEKDIEGLTLESVATKLALRSWQEIMAGPLDRLAAEHHGRTAIHDGELGPATLASFDTPRCGIPDYQLGGRFQAATGFPRSCAATGISFSINKAGMPSKFNDTWDTKVLGRVILNYATFGVRLVPYVGSTPAKANIPTVFKFLPGSTIGYTYFNQGRCTDVCDCALDSGFAPSEAAEADLVAHEWGHAIGLGHTFGGVMNASLGSVSEPWQGYTKSDPSWPTLVRLYGGEPLDPVPTPDGLFEYRNGEFFIDSKSVGKLSAPGVTFSDGDILYGGKARGRFIMIPPF